MIYTQHAVQRMQERGITGAQVNAALATAPYRHYYQDGSMANGWRYSAGGVTVVTDEARAVIITVW